MSSIKNRVVVLVDMDCFYVQVVQRKDPSLKGKPCAVVQYQTWRGGGIIAVGYEARKFGVTRSMRGNDAKLKCPEIALVHVPENRGKADLTQFREAGAEVIQVLSTFSDELERASIDEAYIDLTTAIEKNKSKYTVEEVALKTFTASHIVGLDNLDIQFADENEMKNSDMFKQWMYSLESNEHNYNLAIGAIISDEMRQAVKENTGFSCSAGIGTNKMLAKIVAGFHKPNQQTLILQEHVSEMFKTTKMRKIRSLGGKLGQQLEDKFKVEFMAELCSLSLKQLQDAVGSKLGELVYWLCRGVDHEPVRVRQLPKSLGCSKNFMGKLTLRTKADVRKWIANLSEEVVERLEKEKEQNNRVASLFTVGCTNEHRVSQSRRCSVLQITHQHLTDEAFKTLLEFNTCSTGDDWAPGITNLSLNASKFNEVSIVPKKNMSNYFRHVSAHNLSSTVTMDETRNIPTTSESPKKLASEKKSIENFFQMAFKRNALQKKNFCSNGQHHAEVPVVSENDATAIRPKSNTNSVEDSRVPGIRVLDENPVVELYHQRKSSSFQQDSNKVKSTDIHTNHTTDKASRFLTKEASKKRSADALLNDFGFLNTDSEFLSNRNQGDSAESSGTENRNSLAESSIVNSADDLMNCEKCGKRLLAWDLPDHLDFHYAKELQSSFRNDFLNLYSRENASEPQKKRAKMQTDFRKYFGSEKSR